MAYCSPSCAVPFRASSPVPGLRSPYSLGCGYGLGYSRLGYGSPYSSYGTSASSLGITAGVQPSCINQLPSSQLVIQPPSSLVTVPGLILSASGEPAAVGGNTACAAYGCGFGGYGLSGYGLSGYGFGGYGRPFCGPGYLRRRSVPIRRRYYRSVCRSQTE